MWWRKLHRFFLASQTFQRWALNKYKIASKDLVVYHSFYSSLWGIAPNLIAALGCRPAIHGFWFDGGVREPWIWDFWESRWISSVYFFISHLLIFWALVLVWHSRIQATVGVPFRGTLPRISKSHLKSCLCSQICSPCKILAVDLSTVLTFWYSLYVPWLLADRFWPTGMVRIININLSLTHLFGFHVYCWDTGELLLGVRILNHHLFHPFQLCKFFNMSILLCRYHRWLPSWGSSTHCPNHRWSNPTSLNIPNMGARNHLLHSAGLPEPVLRISPECTLHILSLRTDCSSTNRKTDGSVAPFYKISHPGHQPVLLTQPWAFQLERACPDHHLRQCWLQWGLCC